MALVGRKSAQSVMAGADVTLPPTAECHETVRLVPMVTDRYADRQPLSRRREPGAVPSTSPLKGPSMRLIPLFAVLAFAVAAFSPAVTTAQVPPTRFYGYVTINGEIAPPGTEIRGFVNGNECGVNIMDRDDGLYVLDVAHDATIAGCALNDGDLVSFTINGAPAAQEGAFGQGMFIEVNLSPLE